MHPYFEDEHRYLYWYIQEEYRRQIKINIFPYEERARSHLDDKNFEEAEKCEAIAARLRQRLYDQRLRKEENLKNLKLDWEIKNNQGCPNCGSSTWDDKTGCGVCGLGPEDLE